MTTLAAALAWGTERLQALADPQAEAAYLLMHCTGVTRATLVAWPTTPVSEAVYHHYQALIARRAKGEPAAYLIGQQGFWCFDALQVTADTLIPRPDTESLVETVLETLSTDPQQVLDMGTGSGAIALALAKSRPAWHLWASDISAAALAVAQANARQYDLAQQVTFHHGAYFEGMAAQQFDAICSNPPYLAADDPHLTTSIRYEPRQALVADHQGMGCYMQLVAESPRYLRKGGWLFVEHGYTQAKAVKQLFTADYQSIFQVKDLSGIIRVTAGQLKNQYSITNNTKQKGHPVG